MSVAELAARRIEPEGTRGELMAKAPDVGSLDEQISSLLESIEVEVAENGSSAPPVQEEVPAPPPSKPRPVERAKPAPVPKPARKQAKAAPPRRKARPAVKEAPRKRKPAPARKAVANQRPARTRVRAARAQSRTGTRPRPRGPLFADPAMRELAFFVLAGLMIGAAIGVLIALSG
jgi:outer membrane biosynthesis protein TonB